METIEITKNNKTIKSRTKVFENIKPVKPLLNEKAWNIFKELSKKESYPSHVAKKLKLSGQEAYYYINKLKKAGLIELIRTEEKGGAFAKYYKAKEKSITLVPSMEQLEEQSESVFVGETKELSSGISDFLKPFISNGKFNAKIIVGSPDAHGENKARARDSHLAVELACALGSLSGQLKHPIVFLDTMIKGIEKENNNLIIIGGPITNRMSNEIMEHLPIYFELEQGQWIIKSKISEKEYIEDSVGVIEKIAHPNFPKKSILFLAGKRNAGTKAAVLAFIKKLEDIAKGNLFDNEIKAKAVEGLDLDSDGQIDEIEIKE